MFDWSKESSIRLIEYYQVHPVLWNPKHTDFKDEAKKREAWTAISVVMKSERAEVERKMRSLIFQYNKEKKKEDDKKFVDTTELIKPFRKWYAMDSLSFLSNSSKTARSITKGEQESGIIEPKEMKEQMSRRRIVRRHYKRNSSTIKRSDIPPSRKGSYITTNKRILSRNTSEILSPSTTSIQSNNKPTKKSGKKVIRRKNDEVSVSEVGVKSVQQKKPITRDEYQIYGEHIACKIRKLPTHYSKVTVEYCINNIIHQAELGQYNHPPTAKNSFGTSPYTYRPNSFRSTSNISNIVPTSLDRSITGYTTRKESSIKSTDNLAKTHVVHLVNQ